MFDPQPLFTADGAREWDIPAMHVLHGIARLLSLTVMNPTFWVHPHPDDYSELTPAERSQLWDVLRDALRGEYESFMS